MAYLSIPESRKANQLYLANADGSNIRAIPGPDFSKFMPPPSNSFESKNQMYPYYGPPQWSPDSQLLATAVWANGDNHFLVIQSVPDDYVQMLLPVQGINLTYVAWSPDGSAIAYLTNGERELRIWWPRLPVKAGTRSPPA